MANVAQPKSQIHGFGVRIKKWGAGRRNQNGVFMNMPWTAVEWSALGTWVGAIANILLGVVALLTICGWRPSPKLSIIPFEGFRPHPIWGHAAHWIGLKVQNTGWSAATNCHVYMTSAWRKNGAGDFELIPIPFPMLFTWTPSEWPQMNLMIKNGGHWRSDFAALMKDGNTLDFCFALNPRPADFTGKLKPDEVLRLEIHAESDQSSSLAIYVEVCWNGKWDDDPSLMQKHVRVVVVDRPRNYVEEAV